MEQKIKIYSKKNSLLWLIPACIAFVIGGLIMVWDPILFNKFIGLCCIIFFGGCGLLYSFIILKPGPMLILTDSYIIVRSQLFSVSRINFLTIDEMVFYTEHLCHGHKEGSSYKYIGIKLKDSSYLPKFNFFSRYYIRHFRNSGLIHFPVTINVSLLRIEEKKLIELLHERGIKVRMGGGLWIDMDLLSVFDVIFNTNRIKNAIVKDTIMEEDEVAPTFNKEI